MFFDCHFYGSGLPCVATSCVLGGLCWLALAPMAIKSSLLSLPRLKHSRHPPNIDCACAVWYADVSTMFSHPMGTSLLAFMPVSDAHLYISLGTAVIGFVPLSSDCCCKFVGYPALFSQHRYLVGGHRCSGGLYQLSPHLFCLVYLQGL